MIKPNKGSNFIVVYTKSMEDIRKLYYYLLERKGGYVSRQAAVKCFLENTALFKDNPEEVNHYNGLANLADKNFDKAKRCFEENIRLFGQDDNHKYNLYNGLWNLVDCIEKDQ